MNNAIPAGYDYINVYNSEVIPSTQHTTENRLSYFFRKYLMQKAISVFEWTLPETWNRDYFLYTLYAFGTVAVFDTAQYGVIPQGCSLTGYGLYYQPTTAIVTNPNLPGMRRELTIDRDCILFKMNPDYTGICDIINYYGDMMALTVQAIRMNLSNSKLSTVFSAANKTAAESFKKAFDQMQSGELMVAVDKSLFNTDGTPKWDAFTQNVGQNYIGDKLMLDLRKWEESYDTEIGIPNANTTKRERLNTDEVNANNFETRSKCELWLEAFQNTCRKISEMFPGTNISVNWRGGVSDGDSFNIGAV